MELEVLIEKTREQLDHSPSGKQCRYIKINEKWGLKLYRHEHKRDECYDNQYACACIDLAPQVGDTVDLPEGEYRYGYITENAEVLFDANEKNDKKAWDWHRENINQLFAIADKIKEETDFFFCDDHPWNWGLVDGKLVPIDFGEYDNDDDDFSDIEDEMLGFDDDELSELLS